MKLYVGKLVFQTSREDLQNLFAQAGTVESGGVVEDRDPGRSRGFGFIEMSTKEEGAAAISQFNGRELGGRALNVNEAKPREDRAAGGGGRGGFGAKRQGRAGRGEQEFGVIEIVAEDDEKPTGHAIIFGPAQDEKVAQYFMDIAESRKRAHKTQTEINRVKKKTLAILDELS
jgi:RNA recognition motif-containing protein